MMKKTKVSIIVPVYNAEKYLDKCLKSLVNQTLPNIEIIVVNDGSLDNSDRIIKEYVRNYPNLIKNVLIPNNGVSNARNVGLKKATGEYIGFCDSDDFVELNMYELLYNKGIETESDIVVSGHFYDKENGKILTRGLGDMNLYSKSLEESKEILLVSNPYVSNKIFNRNFLGENKLRFNKKYRIFEDLLFTYSAFLKANKIEKIDKPLYHYVRRKEESVTGSLNKKFYDLFPVMEELKEFYHKNTKEDFDEYLTYIVINHSYLRFKNKVKLNKLCLKYRYIKYTYKFLDKYDSDWKNNIYFSIKNKEKKRYKTKPFWIIYPYLKKIKKVLISKNK